MGVINLLTVKSSLKIAIFLAHFLSLFGCLIGIIIPIIFICCATIICFHLGPSVVARVRDAILSDAPPLAAASLRARWWWRCRQRSRVHRWAARTLTPTLLLISHGHYRVVLVLLVGRCVVGRRQSRGCSPLLSEVAQRWVGGGRCRR